MQKSDKQEEINMKRYYPLVFALICILFLSGCQTSPTHSQDIEPATSEITNIPECLLNENGTHYLILPISKEKIWIWDEQIIPYLDDIDFTLLKAAEEKSAEMSLNIQTKRLFIYNLMMDIFGFPQK